MLLFPGPTVNGVLQYSAEMWNKMYWRHTVSVRTTRTVENSSYSTCMNDDAMNELGPTLQYDTWYSDYIVILLVPYMVFLLFR